MPRWNGRWSVGGPQRVGDLQCPGTGGGELGDGGQRAALRPDGEAGGRGPGRLAPGPQPRGYRVAALYPASPKTEPDEPPIGYREKTSCALK